MNAAGMSEFDIRVQRTGDPPDLGERLSHHGALGEVESPFASAITSSAGAVESFVREVETRYKLPLG